MRLAIGLTLVYAGLAHAEVALPGPAAPDRADPTPAYYFARFGMSSYGFQLGGSYAW